MHPLAGRYQTVAVDLAGHGDSGVGRRAWTMAAFGDDVVAIVEAALRLGDRVAGLVWVDTYNTLGEPRTGDEIGAFVAPFREDFVTATRAGWGSPP